MYTNNKQEMFLLNNFKRAWSAITGDATAQIQDYYGRPRFWTKDPQAPKRVQMMVPDGEGRGMRYYTVLVPEEGNYLIEG
ncbi:hypothetical protein Q5H92_15030 [Hymenobacter sp. M29]|uniref:Uncharacterized protein n=1 Tax=Hymenobacter mellowenesis TaxID=3063995 RepID=A0ABT9ACX2_9BACT|nr:hypothetical protein [Hymenobacter sp. M29]MDO7847681.1 hypothetical protein [Hymenobacter sp. M29]